MYDLRCKIKLFKTNKGGRINDVFNGYRPQFKFDNYKYQTSGFIYCNYSDKLILGKSYIVYVSILGKDYFNEKLSNDLHIFLYEGKRQIGEGYVIEILNNALVVK